MEPTTSLTVTLQAQQWQAVLNMLAEGSVRVMLPLIQDIQRQLQQQSDGAPSDYHGSVEARDQRGNGEVTPIMAASDPATDVPTPTGTLQGVAM